MDDRRRHLQLLAFTFGPALDIIHVYFENKVLHNTNLNFFLNDHLKKHQLFHEYIPRITCCKGSSCSIANPNKQGCLDKRQFFFLFESNSSIQPNHEIKKGKVITQHCLCQYSAKISVTVDDLDITLISALIQTCCVPGTIPGNLRWLTDIREVRNDVVHNGKGEINNTEFTNLWTKLETAVLEFASLIAGPLKKLYKKQIDEIKTKSLEHLSKVINDSSEKTMESFILSNNGISTSFVAVHENIKTAIQNNADNMKNTLEKTTTLLNESQELSRAEIVKEVHNTHTNMMKTIASETSALKGHVTDEQKSVKQMVQEAIATSTFEVKKEIQRGKAHFFNEAAKTGKRNNNLIKGISRKLGMLTEEVRQLKAQIAINESAKGTNNDLKNGQLKDTGTHRIKAEAEIDSVIIDEDKTLQRIPSVQKNFNKEQFHIESSDKKCILLKMSADPLIFKDENSLRSAIRSLIEKVIEAAEIDVSIDNTIDVSLTFTSPLTTDQRETVYSLLSKCGVLNDNENSVERLQQDAPALQSSVSRKRLEDLPEIYDSISYSKSEPVELVQITVNNIEFEVQVKGFPKEKENEKIMYDSESETLYVHWTLDCPKDWNLKSIKETMKNMESKYVGCFRIDVFYSDMFDRLSLDTTTQRNVVNTFLCMELEIQTFLEQIVESCQIKSETPSDVSVIVTILPGADKNADDIDVDELTEDDNLVNCRHCKHTFVCTKCTKMAKKMAALKTILYLKEKNIEDLQADLKNTDTTNKEDAKGSETEGSEFETEEDMFKEPLNKKKKSFEDTITTEPGFKKKQSIQHLGVTSSEDKDVDHMDVSGIFIDRARHKIDSWNTKLNLLQSQKQECFKLAGLPQLDRLIKNSFSYYQSRYVSKRLFLDPIWERLTKIERQIRGKIRNYKGVIEEESKTTTDTDQDQICNMNLKSLITCSLCKTIDEKNIMAWCKTCSKLMCSSCVLIHLTNTTDHSIEYDKDYLRGYKYKSQIAVNMVNILNVHAIHAIQCVNSSILTVFHERMHGVPNFAVFGFDGNKKHDFELSGFNSMFDLSFIVPITDDLVVVTHDTASHMEIINYTNGSILNRIPTHREAGEKIKGVAFISNRLIVGFSNGIDILNMSGGKVSRIDLKDVQILRSVGNGKLFCRHRNHTSSDIINSYIDIPNNTISTLTDFKCNPTDITIDDEGNIIFVQNGVIYQVDYSGQNSKIIITSGTSVRCVSWENSSKTLCITHFDSSFYHSSHAIYMYSKD